MVCNLLESTLEKYDKVLNVSKFGNGQYDAIDMHDKEQLKCKLLVLTKRGFPFLTQSIVQFYRDKSIFDHVLNMDREMCKQLLLLASSNDNVEFFKYICDSLKPFIKFNVKRFLKTFKFAYILIMKSSPLIEAMRKGNYKLVEYLFNYIGDDVKEINDLWLACFYDNWKDSGSVVRNKMKIFLRLKLSNQNFQVERLEFFFPTGVNVVLLTTVYDLFDYVPCEKNLHFIAMCISYCCREEAEFDNLVHWFLSKNLAHLLTHMYQANYCLLNRALFGNLMKSETLSMFHKEYYFDLGIILKSGVLCKRSETIVKAIVELSCDVNCVYFSQNTLLHWAACFRKLDLMKYILSIGADVNLKNSVGNTPLHQILQNSSSLESLHLIHDSVSLLIANKADISAKNIAGLSAFQLAKAHQDEMSIEEKTLTLLENFPSDNATVGSCSSKVIKSSMQELKKMDSQQFLTAYRCDCFFALVWNIVHALGNVNLSNLFGKTLLHRAAIFGDLKTMEYLLLFGADANLKDNNGDTPLHNVFDWEWRNKRGKNTLLKKTK